VTVSFLSSKQKVPSYDLQLSILWCPRARQLSRAYAGCIWDNTAVLGDTIKGTSYIRVTGAYDLQRICIKIHMVLLRYSADIFVVVLTKTTIKTASASAETRNWVLPDKSESLSFERQTFRLGRYACKH
jgi:hypothetical protein